MPWQLTTWVLIALSVVVGGAQAQGWSTAGSVAAARSAHTATLLTNGKLLLVGGSGSGGALASAELYDSVTGSWSAAGSLAAARFAHTATLLPSGKVLVVGGSGNGGALASAELYDPATGNWTAAGNLTVARDSHTATLLPSGKVLVVGGVNAGVLASAELYDPATGNWSAAGNLVTARYLHTTTLLPSGKVLVVGGAGISGTLASAELYDPATGNWSTAGNLTAARYLHTATLMPSGKVLVVGGRNGGALVSTELYDPAVDSWSATDNLTAARSAHTATLLPSGRLLVVGGGGSSGTLASAELYDPATDSWGAAGSLAAVRREHTATLLPSGRVLVVGGVDSGALASAELYDSVTGSWSAAGSLAAARFAHTATLLPSGKVLVVGGSGNGGALASAELYDPVPQAALRQPQLGAGPSRLPPMTAISLVGLRLQGDSEASGGTRNNSATNLPLVQLQRLDNGEVRWLVPVDSSATSVSLAAPGPLAPGSYALRVFVNGMASNALLAQTHTAPAAPTGLVATAGNAQVQLSWTVPADDGGSALQSYTVTGSPSGTCTVSAPATSCTIGGLSNGTAYTFIVKATNGAGDSAASASASATPLGVSDAPTGLTATAGNAQVQLGWTAPVSNGGGNIISYTVTGSPNGTCTVSAPATSCTIGGLSNGTAYTFTVKATNGAGDSAASASVSATPLGVSDAPTGLTATAGNAQVQLGWTAPVSNGGGNITSYTVTGSPNGTCTVSAPAISCTIGGLSNGTAYTFTVKATNGAGDSAASASASATPATAPGVPTGLIATASDRSVVLSWSPPASNGGSSITSYIVTGSPGGTCTVSAPATSCAISGLTNGTSYTFTVKATNGVGDSVASVSASATPVGVPGTPTGLTAMAGDSVVQLSWAAPASNGGSSVTSYTVAGSPGGTCTVNAPATSCTISGLANGTAYSFTVKATNGAGDSAASASASATPVSVPGTPTGLTATVGDSAVQLGWAAPASNGGSSITSYTVVGSPGGTCTVNAPATSCTISGLANGTAYSFTVKATNGSGDSAASSSVSATPQLYIQPSVALPGGGTTTVHIGAPPACTVGSLSINSTLPAGAPAGATAPVGVLRFTATGTGCNGASLPVRIDYPAGRLAGLTPYKYGPAAAGVAATWFAHGSVSGDSVSFSVTDNGVGDNDSTSGLISDPFAPLLLTPGSAQAIPTLSEWGLMLMLLLAAAMGMGALRRRGA